ncbi:MAG TPA: DUF5693 family protein [bacterium]|nr:DUF5693 family protein [bacterium]
MTLRPLITRHPLLSACVVVGLLAALIVLAHRQHLEQSYRTVEITVDGDDWTTLGRRTGTAPGVLYDALYRAGARSVTVYSASLRRLADSGRVTYLTGADVTNAARTSPIVGPLGDLLRGNRIQPGDTYVAGPRPLLEQIRIGLSAQLLPHMGTARATILDGSAPVLEIQGRGQELEDDSIGLLSEDVAAIREHHLAVEARIKNLHEVAPDGLEAFFARLRSAGERFTLIFDGNQVLGFDQLIPDVAAQMKSAGFAFGQIESFTARRRQRGDLDLARAVAPAVIRVFSLTPDELAGLSPDDARDKFVLAARERNVRILYIRPFLATSAGIDEVQANVDYVESISNDLRGAGFQMGKASSLPFEPIFPLWVVLMALGTLAASAIAVAEGARLLGRPVPARPLYVGVGIGLVLTVGVLAAHHLTLWSQALAFLAALAFPTLSLMGLLPAVGPAAPRPGADGGRARISGGGMIARSIGRLWALSGVTALGGVMVAALLSQWSFMMEIREFLGVKLAHIVPVAVLGLLLVAAEAPPGQLWPRLRAWGRRPLLLEYGVAFIVVGIAAVFALGRTGNAGLPVLGSVELRTRVILEHLVIARPRTKEFLIGDPFMVLTFALAMLGARRWLLPAALIGAVGQVGLVNSFSHIHTPLVYIILRTIYALAIGSAIGAVLVGVVLWSRRGPASAPARPDPAAAGVGGVGSPPMR